MPRREMKRDTRKEAKAEKAAKLNTSIETQLLVMTTNALISVMIMNSLMLETSQYRCL